MNADKQYITQITHGELQQIAGAANMYAGEGIIIDKNQDGYMISIDKVQLKAWIKAVHNGGDI